MNKRWRGPSPCSRAIRIDAALQLWVFVVSRFRATIESATAGPVRLESLLSQMTLQEKLGQLTLFVGQWTDVGPRVAEGGEQEILEGKVGTFYGIYGADYTREMQRLAVEESRLGVPLLFSFDVVHGFRTIFPVPLAQAGSWNPSIVEAAARVAAAESSAHGLHWTFAPMVDVSRDPRWGRVVEGPGEDPYLASAMAAAQVRGYQGSDLAAVDTVAATAKHFVAYGGAEGGRDYNTVDTSERTLHEVYMPPFRAAVRAGCSAVMPSFNDVDGVPMHANGRLIDGLLRGTWAFEGVVVSDYTGIVELIHHGVAQDRLAAGRMAIEAGVDVDLVGGVYLELEEEIASGRISENVIDEAVLRVLRLKERLGLFDDPFRYCSPERERSVTLMPDHRALARRLARESIILLKNDDGLLPLDRNGRNLAVVGRLADCADSALGGWSAAGRADDVVTVLEGLRRALPDARITYVDDVEGTRRAAAAADAVVLVVGEHRDWSAEASSRGSIDLTEHDQELARAVHASGTPAVAVVTSGRPLAMAWLDAHVPAVIQTWFLGIETGTAVADVLLGDYNPGGKLPMSIPRMTGQIPIYYNHKNTGRPPDPDEKYTSKYIDVPWTPLYPFGHGLSYTTFAYESLRLSAARMAAGESIRVEVEVANTGDRAGDEVVQLYVRDEVASVTRPVKQLRGFRRIHLRAGEGRVVSFELADEDLALHDREMKRIVEPGFFTVYVGGCSEHALEARFEVVASTPQP